MTLPAKPLAHSCLNLNTTFYGTVCLTPGLNEVLETQLVLCTTVNVTDAATSLLTEAVHFSVSRIAVDDAHF